MKFNYQAIYGLLLRHWYTTIHHMDRFFEIIIGPVISVLLWGFLSVYTAQAGTQIPFAVSFFLGAVILWGVFHHMAMDLTISFNFNILQKNILNVFSSPVNFKDYLVAIFAISFVKLLVSFVLMLVLSAVLFGFNIFGLGIALAALFFSLLISGLAVGFFIFSLIMRFGSRAAPLSWWVPAILQAFSAVFYPVSALPSWAKTISLALPTTYSFEGMRTVLFKGEFPLAELSLSLLLGFVYLILALAYLFRVFNISKEKGFLLRLE